MARQVNVKLVLTDAFSGPMVKATATMQRASKTATAEDRRRIKAANAAANAQAKALNRQIKSYTDFAASVRRIAARLTAAVAGTVLVGGVKTGLTTGAELETLRANIETVTKSAERASAVMTHAITLANKSAFSNEQLIGAASMLETYGLRTEKYLTAIGDAAAITGQDVNDLAKAFGKATTTGQFQALSNIGITRETLNAYAKAKGINLFSGTKIKDPAQFADTLSELLAERYGGGMARQASTITGMVSTIKGMVSTAAAQIVGVTSAGTVQLGSLFDRVRNKIADIMATLERWQADGTLETIATRAGQAFGVLWAAAKRVGALLTSPTFLTIAGTLTGIAVAVGVVTKAYAAWKAISQAVQIVQLALNAAMTANPIGIVVVAIAALVAGMIALYQKCEWFRTWVRIVTTPLRILLGLIKKAAEWIGSKFGGGTIRVTTEPDDDIPSYASGTNRHPGGPARINERGGEIVDLPSGARVIPAPQARREAGRGGNTINIYVTGANRSDEQLADMIAARVMEAIEGE